MRFHFLAHHLWNKMKPVISKRRAPPIRLARDWNLHDNLSPGHPSGIRLLVLNVWLTSWCLVPWYFQCIYYYILVNTSWFWPWMNSWGWQQCLPGTVWECDRSEWSFQRWRQFFSHVFIMFVGRTAQGQSLFSDKVWQTSTRERKRYSGAWFSSTILDVVALALSTAVAPFAEATNGGAKPLVPERNVILEYLRSNEMRGTGQLRLRASRESCYEAASYS